MELFLCHNIEIIIEFKKRYNVVCNKTKAVKDAGFLKL
jgi:hypothetical protein